MNLLQILFAGLSSSAIYAVMALGFVVIYKGTKVVNLAQGSIMLLGVYVISLLSPALGFWVATALGLIAGILLALAIQWIVSKSRTEDHLVMTILTIGVDIFVTAELVREISDKVLFTGDPWKDDLITIGEANLPVARAAALIVSAVLITVFFLVFRLTPFGVKMRAAASDAETSALMGVSQRQVAMWSWAIGGGLAVIGGIFLAAFPGNGLGAHSGAMAMAAIPAIIIGGMDSSEGAVVGGLVVGFSETISRVLIGLYVPWLNDGFATVVPYILMLVVLLVKPSGLFGSKEINRV
jgi:branched-chain amino acid transport system permease protein